jgi:CTP synthase (UTP-ammonia lyase)
MTTLNIGIIGDFNPRNTTHTATDASIVHAADALGQAVRIEWVPTLHLEREGTGSLASYQALWCSPGSPYESMEGALAAIQFARETNLPFFGT